MFNQSQWDRMGFIALWWRALLWRWTVTLLSKWNHRLASIPREKGHLLSTGECSRGGYARWRLHAFSTQLPCIAIHLWSEKTDSAKAKLMYNIEFEYPSLYCQQRRSKTGARTHRQKQTHLVGSISAPAHMRSLKSSFMSRYCNFTSSYPAQCREQHLCKTSE